MKRFKYALPLVLGLSLISPLMASAVMVDDTGTTEIEINQPVNKTGGKVNGKTTAKSFKLKKGEYMFAEDGKLINSKGKKDSALFNEILSGAQERVATSVKDMAKEKFSKADVEVSVLRVDGDSSSPSFFGVKDDFYSSLTTPLKVNLKGKSKNYIVVFPNGLDESKPVNGVHVANTLKGMRKYEYAIKEAVVAGTLPSSFNLLSMYPSRQLPLVDILTDEVDKKGVKTGKRVFKKSNVTMNYALNKFSNPLFGELDGSKVPDNSNKYWESKIKGIKFDWGKDGKNQKGKLKINENYLKTLDSQTTGDTTFQSIDAKEVESTNAISNFVTKYSKKEYSTLNRVDMGFPLMTPKVFTLDIDNNSSKVYKLGTDGGFKVDTKTKFLLATDSIYVVDEEGKSKRVGDYSAYGVGMKSLVMATTRIDSKGKYSKKGKKVGAIVPQNYREMMIDIKGGSELYWTGRVAKFSNDYSGKISLDKENRDLLAIDTKTEGKKGVKLRQYAFSLDADKTKEDSHKMIEKSPKQFSIQIAFHSKDGVKGFYLYRNNAYAEDKDLVKWLKTDEAKAMTDVKAEALLKIITGSMEKLEKKKLSYEEWTRIQEIKRELDTPMKTSVIKITKLISIIFGMFLLVYATALVLAYFIDIVNFIMETSLLSILTFGRLRSIDSELDVSHSLSTEGTKLVGKWYVLTLSIITSGVGLIFIFITPLIELATYLFYMFSDLLGGV